MWEQSLFPCLCVCCPLFSDPFRCSSHPRLRYILHTHTLISVLLITWRGPSVDLQSSICSSLLLQNNLVNSSHLGFRELSAPSPEPGEFSGICLGSHLHCSLKKLLKQWAVKIVGLTSFVSYLSGITVLHCLVSTVLKNIVSYILSIFCLFLSGKSSPCSYLGWN